MREAFPEASVHGFEHLEEGLTCHPKDRHVLAAAVAAGAETLVTANVRDFPDEACEPHDIIVLDPDAFLLDLMAQDGPGCRAAVEREAQRMRRPRMTVRDVLAGVAGVVPTFANFLYQAVLDGEVATSDVPAYVAVDDDQTPLQASANAPDLTDPLHVALAWWTAPNDRGRYLNALHRLTWSPPAFGDYAWAEQLLAGRSIASGVYLAVDDPAGDVAFVRFVPELPGVRVIPDPRRPLHDPEAAARRDVAYIECRREGVQIGVHEDLRGSTSGSQRRAWAPSPTR